MNTTFLAVTAFVKLNDDHLYGFRHSTLTTLPIACDGIRTLHNRVPKPIVAAAPVRCFGTFDRS